MTVFNDLKFQAELGANGLTGLVNYINGLNGVGANTVAGVTLAFSPLITQNQINTANALLAAHNGAITLGQADVTTTGTKVIAYIDPGGRIGLPRGYWFGIANAPQSITTPATVSLGVTGPNFTDIAGATPLTGFVQGNVIYVPLTTKRNAITSPIAVIVNVTVAAVSTGVVIAAVKPDIDYL